MLQVHLEQREHSLAKDVFLFGQSRFREEWQRNLNFSHPRSCKVRVATRSLQCWWANRSFWETPLKVLVHQESILWISVVFFYRFQSSLSWFIKWALFDHQYHTITPSMFELPKQLWNHSYQHLHTLFKYYLIQNQYFHSPCFSNRFLTSTLS